MDLHDKSSLSSLMITTAQPFRRAGRASDISCMVSLDSAAHADSEDNKKDKTTQFSIRSASTMKRFPEVTSSLRRFSLQERRNIFEQGCDGTVKSPTWKSGSRDGSNSNGCRHSDATWSKERLKHLGKPVPPPIPPKPTADRVDEVKKRMQSESAFSALKTFECASSARYKDHECVQKECDYCLRKESKSDLRDGTEQNKLKALAVNEEAEAICYNYTLNPQRDSQKLTFKPSTDMETDTNISSQEFINTTPGEASALQYKPFMSEAMDRSSHTGSFSGRYVWKSIDNGNALSKQPKCTSSQDQSGHSHPPVVSEVTGTSGSLLLLSSQQHNRSQSLKKDGSSESNLSQQKAWQQKPALSREETEQGWTSKQYGKCPESLIQSLAANYGRHRDAVSAVGGVETPFTVKVKERLSSRRKDGLHGRIQMKSGDVYTVNPGCQTEMPRSGSALLTHCSAFEQELLSAVPSVRSRIHSFEMLGSGKENFRKSDSVLQRSASSHIFSAPSSGIYSASKGLQRHEWPNSSRPCPVENKQVNQDTCGRTSPSVPKTSGLMGEEWRKDNKRATAKDSCEIVIRQREVPSNAIYQENSSLHPHLEANSRNVEKTCDLKDLGDVARRDPLQKTTLIGDWLCLPPGALHLSNSRLEGFSDLTTTEQESVPAESTEYLDCGASNKLKNNNEELAVHPAASPPRGRAPSSNISPLWTSSPVVCSQLNGKRGLDNPLCSLETHPSLPSKLGENGSSDEEDSDSVLTSLSDFSQTDTRSFSLSLAELREFGLDLCHPDDPKAAQGNLMDGTASLGSNMSVLSFVSLIPSEDLDRMIEDVQGVREDVLQNYEDIHVVVLHKEEGVGLGFSIAGGADQSRPVTHSMVYNENTYHSGESTITNQLQTLKVHKVFPNGLAAQEGTIQHGDKVLSVNGYSLKGCTHSEALRILRKSRMLAQAIIVLQKQGPVDPNDVQTLNVDQNVVKSSIKLKCEQEPSEEMVTVEITKRSSGLGFSLEGGKQSSQGDRPLTVKKVFLGGPVDLVQPGDEILEIHGQSMQGLMRLEAWQFIKCLPEAPVKVVLKKKSKT
ncbi:uncharacterized protein si:dkey-92i15.4 isoform X2 [Polypterus senegalus]|uniref:uncharacterized protein si:dkey-92i15.4 isoform X2 n=1 Tax=Polypterus senegalus TaxID=55291 RepID=UPI001965CC81|nr:uncharacterized protein si:dkey-92i15.4 isoform X2 [Polypterus senegalus]